MAGRLSRRPSATTPHKTEVTPTTGKQPMANPRASVSANRRGEMPWRSHVAALCFIDAIDILITILSLSVRRGQSDRLSMKLCETLANGAKRSGEIKNLSPGSSTGPGGSSGPGFARLSSRGLRFRRQRDRRWRPRGEQRSEEHTSEL